MADMTPENALEMFRLNSQPDQDEQAAQIRAMETKDAIELLAYMTIHQTSIVQALHSEIIGEPVGNSEMPDPGSRN